MTTTQRKRSRLETIYVILTLAQTVQKKTHIMFQANLSHAQFVKYATLLLDRGLLRETPNGFITTPRGRQYVLEFQELQRIMGDIVRPPQGFVDSGAVLS